MMESNLSCCGPPNSVVSAVGDAALLVYRFHSWFGECSYTFKHGHRVVITEWPYLSPILLSHFLNGADISA